MEGPAEVSQSPRAGAGLPDLTYTEQEQDLRAAVRSVLDDQADWPAVLARTESGQTCDAGLWRTLAADIGCAGLTIPESLGGAGASYRELAVLAEEAGRAVAPVPYLGSAVLATAALLAVADGGESGDADGTVTALLTELAGGVVTASLAIPVTAMPGRVPVPTVRIGPEGSGGQYRLSGTISAVADVLSADVLLVSADGVPPGLYAVRTGQAAVRMTAVTSLDMTRQLADVEFGGAAAVRVAAGPAAGRAIERALTVGAAMLAAEQVGLAERALEMTVAYVKQRHAFARPVGSFQAIKHRLADVWVAITQARATARYAAACLSGDDPDIPIAIALAKAACSEAALLAAEEMVQLHGGIGFTWEHPAHLYLKRAKAGSIALGTPDRHRAALASLADLPPARLCPLTVRPGDFWPMRPNAPAGTWPVLTLAR